MKKTFFHLLLCFILLFCFSSCSIPNNNETNDKTVIELNSQSNELVLTLKEYLQQLSIEYDMPDTSIAIKINDIKNGKQPLHLQFDASSPYFICAYSSATHEQEKTDYCCVNTYTWVKFTDVYAISEYYKDKKYVVSFQINKTAFVKDILSNGATVPKVEHFQIYTPVFHNGTNQNSALTFDKTLIYLNASNADNVYHSTSVYNNALLTLPCVYLDKKYYIMVELYTDYLNGERSENNLINEFGKYYDALMGIIDTEKYHFTNNDTTTFYGLFTIDDFVNCIN